ncbi:ATPase family protein associated with various cellular activities (AAA) [Aminobacter sp. AP02]|nr:ATPase family protein associated with various cellular activities (AAA) [Aminobacter sp. AP02]
MMEARLAGYFVKRLRRRAAYDAVHDAVASGILRVSAGGVADFRGAGACSFSVGPMVAGKSVEEALRMIRRSSASGRARRGDDHDDFFRTTSVKLSANNRGGTLQEGAEGSPNHKAPWLVDAVRASAMPLRASDVATLLLISRAACKIGQTVGDIVAALATPSPLVSISAKVDGFEEAFLDLLAGGAVVPGRVAICEGGELSRKGSMRFSRAKDPRWHAVAFKASELDDDDSDWRERQLAFAAESGYLVVGIAERGRIIPEVLGRAASLHLDCGPLTPGIVRKTMIAVLGACHDGELVAEHIAALSLSDLALTIRAGQLPVRAFELLGDIGRRRYLAAQEMRSAGSSGRSAAGGAKRKPSRGPASGAEVIQPTLPSGSMSDRFVPRIESLAGYGEAAAWALSLREDLDLWRGGKLQWGEMSTRILLSGPPGTGKTLFARALCNSLQVPMIASSVAAWLEPGYLGEVLRRMVGTFAEAEAAKPCILFVDELDGIGSRERRGEWDQYWSSVVNRGLELLDGAARSSGVIVVAASNLPQMIDPALLRSGRLETHIVIPPPDIDALAEILRHHLGADLEAIVASAEA